MCCNMHINTHNIAKKFVTSHLIVQFMHLHYVLAVALIWCYIPLQMKHLMWKCLFWTRSASPLQGFPQFWQATGPPLLPCFCFCFCCSRGLWTACCWNTGGGTHRDTENDIRLYCRRYVFGVILLIYGRKLLIRLIKSKVICLISMSPLFISYTCISWLINT